MQITGMNHQAFMLNSIKKNQQLAIRATEKLVSGKQIHRSADNPSQILRMSRFESQIRGSQVAQKNIQDAISMTQMASSSLDHASQMGQRLRELSVQYQSDTLTDQDRKAIQKEAVSLLEEMNHTFENTKFNGKKLFDKEAFVIQTGANASDQYRITMPKQNAIQAYEHESRANEKKESLSGSPLRNDIAPMSVRTEQPVIATALSGAISQNEIEKVAEAPMMMAFGGVGKSNNGNKGPSPNANPIAHERANKNSEVAHKGGLINGVEETVQGVKEEVEKVVGGVVDDVKDFIEDIVKGIKDWLFPKSPKPGTNNPQPTEPTNPDPVSPDPTTPPEPNEPNEPTTPTTPPETNEPSVPTNPNPTDPIEPTDPKIPTEPTEPTEPTKPNESPDMFKEFLNPDLIDEKILNLLHEARTQMGVHESILERRLNVEMDKESIMSNALSNIQDVDIAKEMMNKIKYEMLSYQATTLLHQDLNSRRQNVLALLS